MDGNGGSGPMNAVVMPMRLSELLSKLAVGIEGHVSIGIYRRDREDGVVTGKKYIRPGHVTANLDPKRGWVIWIEDNDIEALDWEEA